MYILNRNLLSGTYFANVFSQAVVCLFILLTLSFASSGFIFNKVQHQFSLRYWLLVPCVKLYLPNRRSPRFPTTLFPRNFMLWHSTFRSMMHLCVKGIRYVSRLMFLHVAIQLFQHLSPKRLSFLHWVALAFVRNQLSISVGVDFWTLYSVPLTY